MRARIPLLPLIATVIALVSLGIYIGDVVMVDGGAQALHRAAVAGGLATLLSFAAMVGQPRWSRRGKPATTSVTEGDQR